MPDSAIPASPIRNTAGRYRGRFAPTPSGPLHFGSLVAAAGSYLDALAHGGEWHVRIDDIDPPRVRPGADGAILRTLEAFGFEWTGPVVYQSSRRAAYAEALQRLARAGWTYPCTCSRAEIAAAGLAGLEGPRYPGTCRAGSSHPGRPAALRLRTGHETIGFDDLLQGPTEQDVAAAAGDFVVLRADGVVAYHLACVADDAADGFDPIVRGADLMDSTPRQILLQRLLGLPVPRYLHLPVATDAAGNKLSKQTRAESADAASPGPALARVLAFLGHPPPAELAGGPTAPLWAWACGTWSRTRIPACRARPASDPGPHLTDPREDSA